MNETILKIQKFKDFQEGWSFGEGTNFDLKIVKKAIVITEIAGKVGFKESDAFPGLNGELMVTIYSGKKYWEFTVEVDESISFVYEYEDNVITCEENLSLQDVKNKLDYAAFLDKIDRIKSSFEGNPLFRVVEVSKTKSQSCTSLESLTSYTTISEKRGLKVLPSKIPQEGEYRFLVKPALYNKVTPYVPISKSSTHHRQVVIRQSSGSLKRQFYLMGTS